MTLFERIGGETALGLAVDRFYLRVLNDPLLAPFFESIHMEHLKAHQFAFLSQALAGPRKYGGETMSKAHARVSIEDRHFEAVAAHLLETLRELKVAEDVIGEVAAALIPIRSQVVNTASVASA
jgi:hemoglobin